MYFTESAFNCTPKKKERKTIKAVRGWKWETTADVEWEGGLEAKRAELPDWENCFILQLLILLLRLLQIVAGVIKSHSKPAL